MIVMSRALLLQEASRESLSAPVILWKSLVLRESLTVSSEQENYPSDNLANDSTFEIWRAATLNPVTIEVVTALELVDAVGIARHNFGSSQAAIGIEAEIDGTDGPIWVELIAPQILADNSPVLFRFEPTAATRVRLTIEGGVSEPWAAVLYVGKLLVMPHGIMSGHVPLSQALNTEVANGLSEAGHFLGRIITGQSARTSASFSIIPIDWYYDEMEAFIARGRTGPFFFAWLPLSRPEEVGFTWLTSDPKPSMGSMYFDLSLDYGGITW